MVGADTKTGVTTATKTETKPDVALSAEAMAKVKATVPALREHGVTIITRFYATLFVRFPDVRKQFNMDRQASGRVGQEGVPKQVASLARAVILYAKNVDKPEALLPTVRRIAHKHVARGVLPPQYDAVGACLLDAIKEVLGDAATDAIMDAWAAAFKRLASIFISLETELREAAAKRAGYEGFATLSVVNVVDLEDGAKEIWVRPANAAVPDHEAGMFVAIMLDNVDGIGSTMLTANINAKTTAELRLRVLNNGDRANAHLLAEVKVGVTLKVSVPSGEAKKM